MLGEFNVKPRKKDMWTEVTKDLVLREAIDQMGYSCEETDEFFYVMEYLAYVSHNYRLRSQCILTNCRRTFFSLWSCLTRFAASASFVSSSNVRAYAIHHDLDMTRSSTSARCLMIAAASVDIVKGLTSSTHCSRSSRLLTKLEKQCDEPRAGTNGVVCLSEHMIHFDKQQLSVSRSPTTMVPHFVGPRLI